MNRADRIRKLRALIADPATFEGERDNARAMLARLEAAEPASEERRYGRWSFGVESTSGTDVPPAQHGGATSARWWEPWYDVPPARAYGPGRPVRDRMSDEPPSRPWADLDGFEIEFSFDSSPSAKSFEEMLREFRKAAGAREDDETGDRTWTFR